MIKDIIGFEGLYKITSSGKIIRCKTKKRLVNGEYMDLPERELTINGRNVNLIKDGKQHCRSIHRLMAIHFIPNDQPLIKNEVRHKNGNVLDWSLENLEWCSRAEHKQK
jgi:hypothetical protein